MRKAALYKAGDKVFAKVKGYPAWPAVVLGRSGKKFSVQFYGTNETGYIKPEDIYFYLKHKDNLIKGSKKKEFKEALEQIEQAVLEDGTDGDNSEANLANESAATTTSAKRKRSNSDISLDSVPSKKSTLIENEKDLDSNMTNMSETTNEGNADSRVENTEDTTSKGSNLAPDTTCESTDSKKIRLVTEQELKNWIIYADLVKENEDLYKSLSPFPRNYSQNQVHAICLPSGSWAGLKLHKNSLLNFENEYDCADYDKTTASRLLLLRESVASEEVTPEKDPEVFLENFNLTESEIKKEIETQQIENNMKRAQRLKSESALVELDAKIKNSLGLAKAEPKVALSLLDDILKIDFDEIMLKKHCHVVEMVRRLRKYIGNTDEWNLPQEEMDAFLEDASKIRFKAEEVYRKIKSIVNIDSDNTNFWSRFNELVAKFRDDCSKLNKREVFILRDEPYTRQTILDRLEQEMQLQDADIHRPSEEDVDKENHSEIANSE